MIAETLQRIQQSNEHFFLDEKAFMNITTVSPPTGFGKGRLSRSSCLQYATFLKRKRSIICIENTDESCFACPLVVAVVNSLKPNTCTSSRKKEQRRMFDIPSDAKQYTMLYHRIRCSR